MGPLKLAPVSQTPRRRLVLEQVPWQVLALAPPVLVPVLALVLAPVLMLLVPNVVPVLVLVLGLELG